MKNLLEMYTFKCLWGMKRDEFTGPLAACCLLLWLSSICTVISVINLFN